MCTFAGLLGFNYHAKYIAVQEFEVSKIIFFKGINTFMQQELDKINVKISLSNKCCPFELSS